MDSQTFEQTIKFYDFKSFLEPKINNIYGISNFRKFIVNKGDYGKVKCFLNSNTSNFVMKDIS